MRAGPCRRRSLCSAEDHRGPRARGHRATRRAPVGDGAEVLAARLADCGGTGRGRRDDRGGHDDHHAHGGYPCFSTGNRRRASRGAVRCVRGLARTRPHAGGGGVLGAKSILDLPLTLEVLETQGVPILGLGTDSLPSFYSRSSGLPVDVSVATPAEAAKVVAAARRLGAQHGVLLAVPVPTEDELPTERVEAVILQATAEAAAQGIHGKRVTPFCSVAWPNSPGANRGGPTWRS